MDVDKIPAGVDFVGHLHAQVEECDVFLAVIGPDWLYARDSAGARKLDNPDDFVRVELLAALARNIRVIPVLIDGAEMPKPAELPEALRPLSRRNAVEVRNVQFGSDVERLVGKVDEAFGRRRVVIRPADWPKAAAAGLAVLLVVSFAVYRLVPLEWLPRVRAEIQRIEDAASKRIADARKDEEDKWAAALADARKQLAQSKQRRPNRRVAIMNFSPHEVQYIYAVSSDKNTRPGPGTSRDFLGRSLIAPQAVHIADFDDDTGKCVYHLRAVLAANNRIVGYWDADNFSVCENSFWVIPKGAPSR
jgi:hypothetical protein